MFDSLAELSNKLASTGYFIDPVMVQVVFLASKLKKPLLLEGPAGSGKTQLAVSVAAAAGTHVERLQCYRGVTEDKAIGRFDEGLQRLYMEFSKGQQESWQSVQISLKGRDFFRPGPLMRALECEHPCVLLIDELDKVDDGFEAMLLEILSAWQLSIPEFGTVEARTIPFVVLTSNEERRLGDPIRRRSLYVRVEHPTPQREADIIASRTPDANAEFHREMAGIALSFRNYSLEKPPSVSEMIDFANALQLLGADHVTEKHRDVLLPFLAKTEKDRRHLLLREGFKSLLDEPPNGIPQTSTRRKLECFCPDQYWGTRISSLRWKSFIVASMSASGHGPIEEPEVDVRRGQNPQNSHNACEFCKPMKTSLIVIWTLSRFLPIAPQLDRDSAAGQGDRWGHSG